MQRRCFYSHVVIEIDTDSHKVFKHLANNVPESSVQHCPGIQYYDTDDQPGEDNTWVRQLYSNVCLLLWLGSNIDNMSDVLLRAQFAVIPKSDLPAGAKSGYTFDSCK